MRKQAALILTIITIVAFTLTLNIGNVYADENLNVAPNPITQGGGPVTVTGSGFVPNDAGHLNVFTDNTGVCLGPLEFALISVDGSGNFVISGLGVAGLSSGRHCLLATDFSDSADASTILTVNPAAPIAEYPFGLPLLAILTVISYGIIRRRTRNNLR